MLDEKDLAKPWFGGVAAPLCLVCFALYVVAVGEFTLRTGRGFQRGELHFAGFDAYLFAAAVIAGAITLHGHFYWSSSERLADYEPFVKGGGLVVLIIALVVLLGRQFINFI